MGDSYQNKFVVYTTNNGGTIWNRVDENNIPPAKNGECGLENSYDAFQNSLWFGVIEKYFLQKYCAIPCSTPSEWIIYFESNWDWRK